MALANYIIEFSDLEELWFVVSPQNPLKKQSSLLDDYQRYEMVYRAIEDMPKFRVSNIEFSLPKPSYTATTLAHLREKHPNHEFTLIMGGDNLATLHKWKNHEVLLEEYNILVYPRPGYSGGKYENHPRITQINAPLMEISSSFIRKSIADGKHIPAFLPHKVWQYLDEMNFYKK